MSTYTMTLQAVLDMGFDIGLKDYPIYDESHRTELNRKIVDHYLLFEIGHETPDMFIFALNRKMREIMPLYNKLYRANGDFDPFITIDIATNGTDSEKTRGEFTDTSSGTASETATSDGTEHGTNTTDASSSSSARSVTSETPQTMLSGQGDYATGATDTNSTGQTNSTATTDTTRHDKSVSSGESASEATGSRTGEADRVSSQTTRGFSGSKSALWAEYQAVQINVDMMVVNELHVCFMQLWQSFYTD